MHASHHRSLTFPFPPPPPSRGAASPGCIDYSPFDCSKEPSLDLTLPDKTPLLCTAPNLFYVNGKAGIADNINALVAANKPPFFVTVYGGLKWTTAGDDPKTEFWNWYGNITLGLAANIVPVGAQEMARLAREAGALAVV